MKIAIVGPVIEHNDLLTYLDRYAVSICAQADITTVKQLSDLPPESWDLVFIYAQETVHDAYTAFLSAYPDCDTVLWAKDDQLACSSLRSHPCGFLLPTADEDQFQSVMKRCHSWIKALRSINCSDSSNSRKLRCIEVQYVKSLCHSCTIYCRNHTYTLNRSLTAIQQELGSGFLRCHRGIVVNMRYIKQVQAKNLLLQDGTVLPISPSQSEDIQAQISAYLQEYGCFIQGGNLL